MEESELIDRINALEEAQLLVECSRRAKQRFGVNYKANEFSTSISLSKLPWGDHSERRLRISRYP